MAQFLSQTLIRTTSSSSLIHGRNSTALAISSRILSQRHRSDQSGKAQLLELDLESEGEVDVLGIRKLEDVIHNIIVKRSAPDWLPFSPGSSYWVPPRRRPYGLVDVLGKVSSTPLTEDETLSLTTIRGWPSSSFFLGGSTPTSPVPGDVDVKVKKVHNDNELSSRSEDEEG